MVGVGREEEEFSFLALFLFRILFSSPLLILRYSLQAKGLEQAFAGATRHFNNACSTNFTKEPQTEGVGAGSFPCYVPVHYTGEGEQGQNIEKTENVRRGRWTLDAVEVAKKSTKMFAPRMGAI